MGRKRKIGITTSKIYQMDIRFGKIHAKIHNSGRDKSGTDQHRGRALKYQEKINSTENRILKECSREMESKEWENTRWGKEMKKLQLGGLEQWEREATEIKGQDAIEIWKTFKEKKEKGRRR